MALIINGRVADRQTGAGVPGLRVEVWPLDVPSDQALLTLYTQDNGAFHTEIDGGRLGELERLHDVQLFFRVCRDDDILLSTDGAPLRLDEWPGEIVLPVDLPPNDQPAPDVVTDHVRVRLLDAETRRPLRGIHMQVIHATMDEREFDASPSDGDGIIEFAYTVPFEHQFSEQVFHLHIHDRDNQPVYDTEIVLEHGGDAEREIYVPLPEPVLLEELAPIIGLDAGSPLLDFLAKRQIRTLADARNTGGIVHLEGLPVTPEDPALRLLEAHTELSVLPTSVFTNARIVSAGYTSLRAVADASRERFVEVLGGQIGADRVAALHGVAIAQVGYLETVLSGLRAGEANGWETLENPTLQAALPPSCGCEDCKDATSPAAYLADLMDYALRHLRYNGNSITLTFFVDRYHQPFRELPSDCEAMRREIPQVRIALEVLRAAYPNSGTPPSYTSYLETTYTMLLRQIGTTFDELRRIAPSTNPDERRLYAQRLGITLDPNNDQLKQLFIPPSQLSEAKLDQLFGLRDTRRPPHEADFGPPLLLDWRIRHLLDMWYEEDWPLVPPTKPRALVDPDLLTPADTPGPTSSTGQMLSKRNAQIEHWNTDLNQFRVDPNAGLDMLLRDGTYGLGSGQGRMDGLGIADVISLYQQRRSGTDITARLDQLLLEADAFDYLGAILMLYNGGAPILQSEWNEFNAILIGRIKKRDWLPAWMMEEYQQTVVLRQGFFNDQPKTLEDSRLQWKPVRWRSTEAERRRWQGRLHTRIGQERAVKDGMKTIIRAVEDEMLWQLRELLLDANSNIPREALSQRYQIDFSAGACQMTTRVAQAIETLQGLLFGARNGLLEDPAFTLEADRFDDEWRWMCSYANWHAAMKVFLYPENVLQPTLRPRKSPAFETLVDTLGKVRGQVTPEAAEREASTFERYFADICSLKRAAICRTRTPLEGNDGNVDVLAIGEGRSGTFYFSAWKHLPGYALSGSPQPTPWQTINGFENVQEVVSLFPYQPAPGEVRIGAYGRGLSGETAKAFFSSFDGKAFQAGPELNELPGLVRSVEYFESVIPVSPALAATGTAPWTLHDGDQIAVFDVDGDGNPEVVIFASNPDTNGRNRLGLLRWMDGGMYLDWVKENNNALNGWQILTPDRPLVFSRGVVIVNPSLPGGPQIAFLLWRNGSLELTTPTRTVTGQMGSWTVNLGTAQDPTNFVAANLDGSGKKLVIFEHQQVPPPNSQQIITMATVLDWNGNYTFTFNARFEVTLGGLKVKIERPVAVVSRFGPFGSVAADREDIVVLATAVDAHWEIDPTGTFAPTYRNRYLLYLLRWDAGIGTFIHSQARLQLEHILSDASGQKEWWMDADDRFVAVYERPNALTQSLIIVSPARSAAAILRYKPDGAMEVVWHKEGGVTKSDSAEQVWNFNSNDLMLLARVLDDSTPELLVVRPDSRLLGVIGIKNDPSLTLKWVVPGRTIQSPGAGGAQGWLISPNTRYFVADFDGDGLDEVVALVVGEQPPRLGVLRAVPGPLSQVSGSLPSRYGPVGVTALTVDSSYPRAVLAHRRQEIGAAYKANSYVDNQGNTIYRPEQVLYLDEAYYFVPLELATRLRESGRYTAALNWLRTIFDYVQLPADARIAYKLVLDEGELNLTRQTNWLQDTLNPHTIAEIRKNSYIRYTILTIVHCLLDYADAEFSRATAESVPHARELYLEALDLLRTPAINQHTSICSDLIGSLDIRVGSDEEYWIWNTIKGWCAASVHMG